jgi:peptidoglycan hydrolase-like protein with peptidoglycan-binding domain
MQPRKLRILSAITAGSLALAVVAITANSGTSQTATHTALAAQTESYPPVNLDNCPILHTGYPQGGCVAQLQTDLKVIQDPTLVVDGIFGSRGSQTYKAVIAFQGSHGLSQDGMVGPATKNALKAALSGFSVPTPTVPPTTTPAPGASTTAPSRGETLCKGWGGVVNNLFGAGTGALSPAILGKADLGTPYLDGNVIRADSSVPFYSWGSCGNQVEFQMQSWVCGFWGCEWVTRNHGTPEFFWAHDDTGVVSQQVTMGCRQGTHSYRVHMHVIGLSSTGEVDGKTGKGRALGVEPTSDTEDGPAIQLTC